MYANISPPTFVLPQEYSMFTEEFKKLLQEDKDSFWIMKPLGKSQGKGIFLFNQLKQIADWKPESCFPVQMAQPNVRSALVQKKPEEDVEKKEPYVVQKYLTTPLLVGGKKFDIRMYVLVTSFSPLVAYLYRAGLPVFPAIASL